MDCYIGYFCMDYNMLGLVVHSAVLCWLALRYIVYFDVVIDPDQPPLHSNSPMPSHFFGFLELFHKFRFFLLRFCFSTKNSLFSDFYFIHFYLNSVVFIQLKKKYKIHFWYRCTLGKLFTTRFIKTLLKFWLTIDADHYDNNTCKFSWRKKPASIIFRPFPSIMLLNNEQRHQIITNNVKIRILFLKF